MTHSSIDIADFEQAEHFVLETGSAPVLSDDTPVTRATHRIRERVEIKDRLRAHSTEFVLYEDGMLDVKETRRGKRLKANRLMLRYLDPEPSVDTHNAKPVFKAALVLAGTAALAVLLAQFDALALYAEPVAIVAAATALVAVLAGAYLTHERMAFHTLHGRVPALRLRAGFGVQFRYRSLLRRLGRAIEAAGRGTGRDTADFLRQEMREHYRLRKEGVLTAENCGEGTGRILRQFDSRR